MLQTAFPNLDVARKDLGPLQELWEISSLYAAKRHGWWYGKINTINSENLSLNVITWGKLMAQLKKTTDKHPSTGPETLRSMVATEMESIKAYLPIISSLRTRGLERRHF